MSELRDDGFEPRFARLMALFRDPPKFDFEQVGAPRISYGLWPMQVRSWMPNPPGAGQVARFAEEAERKLYFQDFFGPDANDLLSWPSEQITHTPEGRRIGRRGEPPDPPVVNWSDDVASEWFQTQVIDAVRDARRPLALSLVAVPGSGKSTLTKYLINRLRPYAIANGVVISRFEYLKFYRQFGEPDYEVADHGHGYAKEVMTKLSIYLHVIVLRDLLINRFCRFDGQGVSLQEGLSRQGLRRRIDDLLYSASARTDGDVEAAHAEALQRICAAFDMFLDTGRLHLFFDLDRLSADLMIGLVRDLIGAGKACIVIDGLDSLSPGTEEIEIHKSATLEQLMAYFGRGARKRPAQPGFDFNALFLLRPNTYAKHYQLFYTEVAIAEFRAPFQLAPLRPEVVFFRAIARGLAKADPVLVESGQLPELRERLFEALVVMLRILETKFGLRGADPLAAEMGDAERRPVDGLRRYQILRLFNGNIRDAFRFVVRIFNWLNSEHPDEISLPRDPSIRQLIEALSLNGRKLVRHQGYRLIELLLLGEGPRFLNALLLVQGDLRVRPTRTCLIDNVFCYHTSEHENQHDLHRLLLKVRILQLCLRHEVLSLAELEARLRDELGYAFDDARMLSDALVTLLYAGFLLPEDSEGVVHYAATFQGRVALNLLNNNIYLEHVFHQTLLPRVLIPSAADRPRGQTSVATWARAAIRNCFVLCAYVAFVERHHAGGTPVPEDFHVWPKMVDALEEPFRRILRSDYRRRGRGDDSMIDAVLEACTRLVATWRAQGVIEGEPPEGRPPRRPAPGL